MSLGPRCRLRDPKKPGYAPSQGIGLLRLALPHRQYSPTLFPKRSRIRSVAPAIAFNFLRPKLKPALGQFSLRASMTVPETSVYKHDRSTTPKHEIGLARQRLIVHPKSQSEGMNNLADDKLWRRVVTLHAPHYAATLL